MEIYVVCVAFMCHNLSTWGKIVKLFLKFLIWEFVVAYVCMRCALILHKIAWWRQRQRKEVAKMIGNLIGGWTSRVISLTQRCYAYRECGQAYYGRYIACNLKCSWNGPHSLYRTYLRFFITLPLLLLMKLHAFLWAEGQQKESSYVIGGVCVWFRV
jgi:hypothetical protein